MEQTIATAGTAPLWTILIATLSRRQYLFLGLLDVLLPQCEAAGNVQILACSNDAQETIGQIRMRLLEAATGDYVSFVDDDDMVADDFVEAIVPLLADTPDVVGFNVRYTEPSGLSRPCFLSIRHEPHDDAAGLWRDLTHVQPLKRELALLGDFRTGWPEDSSWRSTVRPHVHTEAYLDREMYAYRHDPRDSVQTGSHHPDSGGDQPRKEITSPTLRYLGWP